MSSTFTNSVQKVWRQLNRFYLWILIRINAKYKFLGAFAAIYFAPSIVSAWLKRRDDSAASVLSRVIWSNKLILKSSLASFSNHNSATNRLIIWYSSLHFMSRLCNKYAYIFRPLSQCKLEKPFFSIRSACWIWVGILVIANCDPIEMIFEVLFAHVEHPIVLHSNIELFSKLGGPKRGLVWPVACPFELTPWVSYFE